MVLVEKASRKMAVQPRGLRQKFMYYTFKNSPPKKKKLKQFIFYINFIAICNECIDLRISIISRLIMTVTLHGLQWPQHLYSFSSLHESHR